MVVSKPFFEAMGDVLCRMEQSVDHTAVSGFIARTIINNSQSGS